MKSLIVIVTMLTSFTAMGSYKLSKNELSIATKDITTYYTGSTVKHIGKRTIIATYKGETCEIKNVTFFKYVTGKEIDEKTYNKLETCFEDL